MKNNLVVLVPFFGRDNLTKLVFDRLKSQSEKFGFSVITCGSEGEKSESLAKSFGFDYIEKENNPVSFKFQELIDKSFSIGFDGYIVVGSDNFISDAIFKKYSSIDLSIPICYGFNDVHFYRTSDGKLGTNGSYNKNKMTIGVARLYSNELLKLDKNLFDKPQDSGIDTLAWSKVEKYSKVVKLKNGVILDVKHEINITSHNIVDTCVDVVDSDEFLKLHFAYEFEALKRLIPVEVKQIKINSAKRNSAKSVEVEFLENRSIFKIGDRKKLPKRTANELKKLGFVKIV